jgi:tRNA A37 threonylcarbamoyladenosine synthetase subunit TsaC/SUA5/YrdC
MDVPIVTALLAELDEPIMSTTLMLPGEEFPETDAEEIQEKIGNFLHAVIDGGHCGVEPTTVIDLTGEVPFLKRQGKGTEHGL